MVRKYRKKPVAIEAIQFTRGNLEEVKRFVGKFLISITTPRCLDGVMTAEISTFEGVTTASENDFIIKGTQGEFYPCKPDIFAEAYEPA